MNRKWVFKSKKHFFFVVLMAICFYGPLWSYAQIEMKETGSHFQNFNSLSTSGSANTWIDNQTLPGWYWQCSYPSAVSTYFSDDGTDTYVGKRCYGTTGDSDRAIGGLCYDNNGPYCYGIKLFNASSKIINNISVGYTGEQWRISSATNSQKILFYYKITNNPDATFTSLLPGTWVLVSALNFVSPKTGPGLIKVLNGNDPTNRVIINDFSIQNITIPPGSFILLRWYDAPDTKYDFGLAIDDVTVKWTVPENGSGTTFEWTGNQSSDWFDIRNWSNSSIPGVDSDVEIPAVAREAVCNGDIVIKSLVIRNGGHLSIEPGKTITVSGNCTFEGPNCMLLKSPNDHSASASFICNGIVSGSGTIKVERYISEYTSNTDGWHFYSSPVNHSAIDDQFIPGTYDDLYTYLESTDTWLNQKSGSNNINYFVNGQGYLVSYKNGVTHNVSGLPNNNSDINFTNLSFTGNRGWHLLGNPFPCGISWGDEEWGISNIGFVAKLLNSGGTYSDLSVGELIPAMNGFFIKVNAENNTITIPKASRIHTAENGWKHSKAAVIKKIKLVINSNSNNTYAETKIMLNEKATIGYDLDYDSPYLSGMYGAPLFYSVLSNGQELSTNCVPEASSLNFNLEFTPGLAKEYTLKAEIANEWLSTSTFILEDTKTKLKYNLNNSSSIKFSSDTTDNPLRFKLMIDITTGIKKEKTADSLFITTKNKHVYVSVPDYINSGQIIVYDLSGRQIVSRKLIKGAMDFSISNTGFYLVQVLFDKNILARKIYVP